MPSPGIPPARKAAPGDLRSAPEPVGPGPARRPSVALLVRLDGRWWCRHEYAAAPAPESPAPRVHPDP